MKSSKNKTFDELLAASARNCIADLGAGELGEIPSEMADELRKRWEYLALPDACRSVDCDHPGFTACPGCGGPLLPVGGLGLHEMPDGLTVPYVMCADCWQVIENGTEQERDRLVQTLNFLFEAVLSGEVGRDAHMH